MSSLNVNPQEASKTGSPPTLNVAIEQNFPKEQRIITDDLAPKLFSGMDKFWIKLSKWKSVRNWIVNMKQKFFSGGWTGFIVRKCYVDDKLLDAVRKDEVSQVVNFGAGLDTRLYRFKELEKISSWELDQENSVTYKRKVMTKALGSFPNNIQLLGVNFIEQTAEEVLFENDFDIKQKTFYIMEAVSQYLDQKAFNNTFKLLSKAESGSYLAFTYVPNDFITGENKYGENLMYKLTVEKGVWDTGFMPYEISELLDSYGWDLIEDIDYKELDKRYVKPTGRNLSYMKVERMVYAIKK